MQRYMPDLPVPESEKQPQKMANGKFLMRLKQLFAVSQTYNKQLLIDIFHATANAAPMLT